MTFSIRTKLDVSSCTYSTVEKDQEMNERAPALPYLGATVCLPPVPLQYPSRSTPNQAKLHHSTYRTRPSSPPPPRAV